MSLDTRTVQIGSRVESLVDAQGLLRGQVYVVRSVLRRRSFVGTFTTFLVEAVDRTIRRDRPIEVGNPHLVLREVGR